MRGALGQKHNKITLVSKVKDTPYDLNVRPSSVDSQSTNPKIYRDKLDEVMACANLVKITIYTCSSVDFKVVCFSYLGSVLYAAKSTVPS